MTPDDRIRLDLLDLGDRVNGLSREVIQGRTELAEKVDRLTGSVAELHVKYVTLLGKVAALHTGMDEKFQALHIQIGGLGIAAAKAGEMLHAIHIEIDGLPERIRAALAKGPP